MTTTGLDQRAPRARSFVTDAALIALGTAAVYAYVASYHKGMSDWYGYPSSLGQLDVIAIATDAPIIAFIVLAIAFVVLIVPLFVWRLLLPYIGIVALVWAIATGEDLHIHRVLPWVMLVLVVVVALVDFSMLRKAFQESRERGEPAGTDDSPTMADIYSGYGIYLNPIVAHAFGLDPRRHQRMFVVALLLFVGAHLIQGVGAHVASGKVTYSVSASDPTLVALREYPDRYICAVVNRQTRQLTGVYRVVDPSTDSLGWHYEDVGPLLPREMPR